MRDGDSLHFFVEGTESVFRQDDIAAGEASRRK
jgi:hypothetical protein